MPPDDAGTPGNAVPPEGPGAPVRHGAGPVRPSTGDRPATGTGRTAADPGHRAADPGHSAAGPIVPSPHRRAPARFSWVGIALLGGAVVIALVVTVGIFVPALGEVGAAPSRDPANLPARISVCGRDWTRDALGRSFTRDEVTARSEADPIVVAMGPLASCPPAVATGGDAGGMATVVYVQTGADAFVPYSLVGGP